MSTLARRPMRGRSAPTPQGQNVRAMLTLSLVGGLLLAAVGLPAVGGIALIAKKAAVSFNELPTELQAGPLAQRSQLLASNGQVIADLAGAEDRVVLPIQSISLNMQKAIIAIEDSRFFEHHGIDFRGLFRALVNNSTSDNGTQGGSTLTQQYVKNVLLERADTKEGKAGATARTTDRKLREARYALALEKRLTKGEILERYLNIAYFGNGVYGVGTAAQHYFGRDASKLTLEQSALLAGLVNRPAYYDPTYRKDQTPAANKIRIDRSQARRDQVLDRMQQLGMATAAQVAGAKKVKVTIAAKPRTVDACESSVAPFFCDYVRTQLLADKTFGDTAEERQRRLFTGGLRVRTTLDINVQKAAQEAVDTTIERTNRVAATMVIVKPGSGEVLAMAINRSYGQARAGYTKVNYAVQAGAFQPGSTFKAFTLAAAIDQGIGIGTTISAPTCYHSKIFDNPSNPGKFCPNGFKNAGDSGEAGVFNLQTGTWHSVNTFFVQLEERVGIDKIAEMAHNLGVHAISTKPGYYGGSGAFTLGTREVPPIEMADAYATFAARGLHCDPHGVAMITDTSNKEISFTDPPLCKQVIPQSVADTVNLVLQGVIARGTGTNASIGRPAAGKTGTTDNYQAAWFVGYVPQMAGAVWVGDPRSGQKYPLTNVSVYGRYYAHVFGGDLGALIWGKAMRAALANVPPEGFTYPDTATTTGRTIEVPDVNGMQVAQARSVLEQAGFTAAVSATKLNAAPIPNGYVAATSPAAGTKTSAGSTVTIFVSNGKSALPNTSPTPIAPHTPSPTPTFSPPPSPPPSVEPSTSPAAAA